MPPKGQDRGKKQPVDAGLKKDDKMELKLTDKQMAEFREAFNLFDKDGDGQITPVEIGHILRNLGMTPTDVELIDLVNECDSDRSGCMEFKEFAQMLGRKLKDSDEEHELKHAFNVLDKNNDGRINAFEFRYALTILGEKLTDSEINELIRMYDHDKDGQLNFAEFTKLMTK